MKVAIRDGCANGGMMDSLSIRIADEYDEGRAQIVEISDLQWATWKEFLRTHDEWTDFWESRIS